MVHLAGEVTIDAPIEEVFDIVADERNEPTYSSRILRAECRQHQMDGPR